VHLGHAAHVELVPERCHGGGAVPGVVVVALAVAVMTGFFWIEKSTTDLFQDLLAVWADVY